MLSIVELGRCEKRFSYREDYTNLKLIVRDEAGNEAVEDIVV